MSEQIAGSSSSASSDNRKRRKVAPFHCTFLLHGLEGSVISVELRNCDIVTGTLVYIDEKNNMTLGECSYRRRSACSVIRMEKLDVSFRHVRFVFLPDSLDFRKTLSSVIPFRRLA